MCLYRRSQQSERRSVNRPGEPFPAFTGRTARELAEHVEAAVRDGTLAPGSRLPSVRQLAAQLDLSPGTVSTALADLRRRGVVVTHQRRATQIADAPPLAAAPVAAPRARGWDAAAGIDARHGGPDARLLPDVRPALRAAARRIDAPRLYGLPSVAPHLAEVAARRLEDDGVPAAHVAAFSGALDGIGRALASSVRPGDPVAVEDPGYADVFDLARMLSVRLLPVAVDAQGPLPAAVAAAVTAGARALIVTPAGQNPTGARVTPARAAALREILAGARELLLLEDQHLVGLTAPPQTLAGATDRWLVVRSMAKAYGPDLRVALAAGDETTVARVAGHAAVGPGWVSHVLQDAAHELLVDPAVAAQVAAAGREYDRRRELLRELLAERGVRVDGESGLNVWLPTPDPAGLVHALAARGFSAASGAPFTLSAAPAVRLTPSAMADDEIRALVDAVSSSLTARLGRGG